MKTIFVLAAATLALSACSKQSLTPKARPHFFVEDKNASIFKGSIPSIPYDVEACRKRIEELVCLVDPEVQGEDSIARPCLTEVDTTPAVKSLQATYDAYPPALQKTFCSLGRIFLEKKSVGTAYAGTTPDGSQSIMGFRAELLLGNAPSLSSWVSWKEQLSFGGPKDYTTRDDLVKVESTSTLAAPANDFVYFVIAHEFGHVLDFQHKVNDWACVEVGDKHEKECTPKSGSWPELSWSKSYQNKEIPADDPWGLSLWVPNESAAFVNRGELCFYGCPAGHGTPSLMLGLYTDLQAGTFLTSYSATNAWDDFAEAVAFYAGTRYTNMQYKVKLPDETEFHLAEKYLNSDQFRAKREWVENFFTTIEAAH